MTNRFEIATIFKAIDKITAPINKMQNRLQRFTQNTNRGLNKISRSFNKLSTNINNTISTMGSLSRGAMSIAGTVAKTAAASFIALSGAVTFFTSKYAVLENAEAAFTPLLGGLDKAQEMVKALNVDAELTPFRFETLSNITKTLLPVMQGDIEKTRQAYKMLGDTAGGNASKLESITRGYTKALLKGKVDMEALNMIAEAGVPIFTELAKSMNETVDKSFFKSISAGKVSVKDIEKAFIQMTSEGGIFFKGMEIASKTTTGRFSTLMDAIDSSSEVIGRVLNPVVKRLISIMTDLARRVKTFVENNEEFLKQKVEIYFNKIVAGVTKFVDWLKKLNAEKPIFDRIKDTLKSLAFIINSIKVGIELLINNFSTFIKWGKRIGVATGIFFGISAAVKVLTIAIAALNLIMATNPIVLAVMGIVAAVGLLIMYWDDLKKSVLGVFNLIAKIPKIPKLINIVTGRFMKTLGFGPVDIKTPTVINQTKQKPVNQNFTPSIVSPQQRNMSMIQTMQKNQTEITIKDDTGRAEITKGKQYGINNIKLQNTGNF